MATLTVKPEEERRVKGLGFLSNKGTDNFSARVITVNGKLSAKQMMCICEASEKYGNGVITFTSRQTVEVQGIHIDNIDPFREYIAKEGLEVGGTGPKVRPIVSCKGTTCQFGRIDTFAVSEEIHKRFYKGYRQVTLPHKFKIAVGGCPNNCVKPDLNDAGIIGQLVPVYKEELCRGCNKCAVEAACPMAAAKLSGGKLSIDKGICNNCGRCVGKCPFGALSEGKQGYKLYLGGRWGKNVSIGKPLSRIFESEEEVLSALEKVILLYRDKGNPGERFAVMIERIGFDKVEEAILSDELYQRKEEILAK